MEDYERSYYEKEIEDFKNADIIAEDGTVDYNKYRAWFFQLLSEKCPQGSDVNQYLDAINLANFISHTAFEDLGVESKLYERNGGVNEKEVIKFVFEECDPESKKALIERLVKEELKKGDINDKNNFGEDTTGSSDNDTTVSELDDKDALDTAIMMFIPTFMEHLDAGKMEEAAADRDYFEKLILASGYQKKSIEESIARLTEMKNNYKERKEERKYNAYQDYKFLFYMYTLGVNYNMALIGPMLYDKGKFTCVLEQVRATALTLAKALSQKASNDSDVYKKKYIMNYIQFKSKYRTEFNLDTVAEGIREEDHSNYKTLYLATLKRAYESSEGVDNIVKFATGFEDLMQSICKEEGYSMPPAFGGAAPEEVVDLLTQLRDPDINLTKEVRDNIHAVFEHPEQADAAEVARRMENEFNGLIGLKDEGSLRVAIAEYKVLNEIHTQRSGSYSTFHPFKYSEEKNALKRMGEKITGIKDPDLRDKANSILCHDKIYKYGYENEMQELNELKDVIYQRQRKTAVIDMGDEKDDMALLDQLSTSVVHGIKGPENEEPAPVITSEDKK